MSRCNVCPTIRNSSRTSLKVSLNDKKWYFRVRSQPSPSYLNLSPLPSIVQPKPPHNPLPPNVHLDIFHKKTDHVCNMISTLEILTYKVSKQATDLLIPNDLLITNL